MVIAVDDFATASGSIDGRTMSDASNTWAVVEGTVTGSGSRTSCSGIAICDSMAAVADCEAYGENADARRTFIVLRSDADASDCYAGGARGANNTSRIYKRVAGSWTQLGSDGSALSSNHVLKFRAVDDGGGGVDLDVFEDGGSVCSTNEGTLTHASGKAGHGGEYNLAGLKDWQCDAVGAPPAGPPAFIPEQLGLRSLQGIF